MFLRCYSCDYFREFKCSLSEEDDYEEQLQIATKV